MIVVADESRWQERRAALLADGPTGEAFLTFAEAWMAEAQERMRFTSPAWALRQALSIVEEKLGRVSAHFLGQILGMILENWEHGEGAAAGLTPVELRLVQDMQLLKVAERQTKAAWS